MQYKPVMESIQKAKVMITKLNTLISGWQKAKGKTVKLYDKSSEKLTEEHYVPNRPELMFSSCCSKAAVPFRWRFTAVGTLSCADSLMLLPLTSKTRTRGWAVKLFSLVYWKKTLPMWLQQLEWVFVETPPSLSALELETPLFCLSATLPVYCSLFCSGFWGTLRGRRCWSLYTVCNKLWVMTQNQWAWFKLPPLKEEATQLSKWSNFLLCSAVKAWSFIAEYIYIALLWKDDYYTKGALQFLLNKIASVSNCILLSI